MPCIKSAASEIIQNKTLKFLLPSRNSCILDDPCIYNLSVFEKDNTAPEEKKLEVNNRARRSILVWMLWRRVWWLCKVQTPFRPSLSIRLTIITLRMYCCIVQQQQWTRKTDSSASQKWHSVHSLNQTDPITYVSISLGCHYVTKENLPRLKRYS